MSNLFGGSSNAGASTPQRSTSPGRRLPLFRSDSEYERERGALTTEPNRRPPQAVVISDRPELAVSIRGLLGELGYLVEVIAGPERPWHHAAERSEHVVVVDVPGVPAPEGNGLDLSRTIAVRPPKAGHDFDDHAARLGLRAVLGRRHAVDELKSLLGDPDATVPDTAESIHSLTDEEVDAALSGPASLPSAIGVGRRIDGRYLLLEPLGRSHTERWRAFDERRLVDVELEIGPVPPSDSTLKRFLDAARRVRRLSHPNIVPLVEASDWNGYLYTATERLPSRTMRHRLESVPGPLALPAVARIGRQVASALDLAHRRGVPHGAVNPLAVRVAFGDMVWLGDFAAHPAPVGAAPDMGRAAYLAPEMWQGEPGRGFGADVWALGVLLYEMAAGFPPFSGDTLSALEDSIRRADPPHLQDANAAVGDGLASVIANLLEREPTRRPADLRTVAERLFASETAAQRLAWTPSGDA